MDTSINKPKKTYIEDLKTVIKTISDELNTSVNEDSMDKTHHGLEGLDRTQDGSQTIFLKPPEVFIKVYQDKSPFCLGTQEKTLDKRVVNYVGRSYDLLAGFYSYIDISFELWLGDVLQNVYTVPQNTFVPLTNKAGNILMVALLNCHQTAVTIQNVKSTETEATILQVGATLSWELRTEIVVNRHIIL
jgi:hypothetical protein